MALGSGWGHDGVAYDGKEMRQHTEALGAHNGIAQTPGVSWGLKVTQQAAPATTVRVAAGAALVMADGSGLFGVYEVPNDASLNSPAFTATSANGRWDRLILRVTSGVPALEIVQGVASGSPAEPAITGNNYLELAKVLLPGSTTNITDAMITDKRVFVGKWAQPWGIVGAPVTQTSPQGTFTAMTDLTGLTITATYVANRRIKITGYANLSSTTANDDLLVAIREGGVTLRTRRRAHVSGSTETGITVVHYLSPTAGAHTYKLSGQRFAGSGSVTADASATDYNSLLIEDSGPSANPD